MPPFRFNFGALDQNADCGEQHAVVKSQARLFQPDLQHAVNETKFVLIEIPSSAPDGATVFKVHKVHVDTADAAAALALEDITLADVVPGQYEGGFKLWEGAQDLMDVIVHHIAGPWPSQTSPAALSGIDRSILGMLPSDLQVSSSSCTQIWSKVGHLASRYEPSHRWKSMQQHLQDLNKGVIEVATYANVVKNIAAGGWQPAASPTHAQYIDGDFQSANEVLSKHFGCQQFDLILTAESIYNPATVPQLIAAFDGCLKAAGVVLVAAKSYYFGVGGGVASFKRALENDGRFQCAVLTKVDDGKSNIREVMLLRRVPPV